MRYSYAVPDKMETMEEVENECDECRGEGVIEKDFNSFRTWFRNLGWDKSKAKKAMQIYRRWKAEQTIVCNECDGRGKWISWR
jgi:hypothetical protein